MPFETIFTVNFFHLNIFPPPKFLVLNLALCAGPRFHVHAPSSAYLVFAESILYKCRNI